MPREKFGGLGSSALHYRFQLWERGGLFERIWEAGLNKFDELEGIDWEWRSADGCQIKVLLATEKNTSRNRICRSQFDGSGKNWVENNIFVESHGVSLSTVICGANRHDLVMLEPLLAERFVSPDEDAALSLNLCLDAGYVDKENLVEVAGYVPHIRPRGEEKCELEHNPNFRCLSLGC